LLNLWKDNTRFRTGYLEQFPGYYFSGDGGYKDEDDYIYITEESMMLSMLQDIGFQRLRMK
jgi:acyl-coenzyme A synthetase/AMP-(fatty) acid ligase